MFSERHRTWKQMGIRLVDAVVGDRSVSLDTAKEWLAFETGISDQIANAHNAGVVKEYSMNQEAV